VDAGDLPPLDPIDEVERALEILAQRREPEIRVPHAEAEHDSLRLLDEIVHRRRGFVAAGREPFAGSDQGPGERLVPHDAGVVLDVGSRRRRVCDTRNEGDPPDGLEKAVLFQVVLEGDQRRGLVLLGQGDARLVEDPMPRMIEIVGPQPVQDSVQRVVVEKDGRENRLLGLVIRRDGSKSFPPAFSG
jgi:hypothetical protein